MGSARIFAVWGRWGKTNNIGAGHVATGHMTLVPGGTCGGNWGRAEALGQQTPR